MSKLDFLWGRKRKEEKLQEDLTTNYLIVGLGNPGKDYRFSRHNVGFMLIDKLSSRLNVSLRKIQFKAITGDVHHHGKKIILVKPQTFMNLSGQAVSSLMRFYKITYEKICIVHDDLDLPFGTIRMRASGGSGGQKGLASIIEKLGSKDFPRLRIGIGRPPGRMDSSTYVLHKFSAQEQAELDIILEHASDALIHFIDQGINYAMTQFNGSVENDK